MHFEEEQESEETPKEEEEIPEPESTMPSICVEEFGKEEVFEPAVEEEKLTTFASVVTKKYIAVKGDKVDE